MQQPRKNIVLITTWFEPLQSVAVNRMTAFVRYLDKTKFDVSVITLGTEQVYGASKMDETTVYRIRPAKRILNPKSKTSDSKFVHNIKTAIRLIGLKILGDDDRKWRKQALNKLKDLHQKKSVDVVISSFSPAAPHLVALEFCKRNKMVKWIVDMRDEMSLNPQSSESVKSHYRYIEKEINRYAHGLISVSEPIVNYFKEVIPGLKLYAEVRNGFDHDAMFQERKFTSVFTILHAGSFYGVRKPGTFFQALERVNRKNLLPKDWKFICAGASNNFFIPDSLAKHVSIKERVSQTESIELMRNSDLNLLVQPSTGRCGVYTGKLFDYLSVFRPILAIVDKNDVAAGLIGELKAGYVADFDNIDEIENCIIAALNDWKSKSDLSYNIDEIKKLHRKFQVEKLNSMIEEILNG